MADPAATGYMEPQDTTGQYGRFDFATDQKLARVRTLTLVKVYFVTTINEVVGTGTVDVQPLVNMVDGNAANSTEHGVVFQIPYVRLQSSTNAIICDPQEGDIGLALICDRDTSGVRNAKGFADPGSRRRFDFADGIYLGSILTTTPTQYLRFIQDGGIQIADNLNNSIIINASGVSVVDKYGNNLILNANGVAMNDQFGHSFFSDANGAAMRDTAGNQVVVNSAANSVSMTDATGNTLGVGAAGVNGNGGGVNFSTVGGVMFITGDLNVSGTIFSPTVSATTVNASGVGLSTHVHFENGPGNFTGTGIG